MTKSRTLRKELGNQDNNKGEAVGHSKAVMSTEPEGLGCAFAVAHRDTSSVNVLCWVRLEVLGLSFNKQLILPRHLPQWVIKSYRIHVRIQVRETVRSCCWGPRVCSWGITWANSGGRWTEDRWVRKFVSTCEDWGCTSHGFGRHRIHYICDPSVDFVNHIERKGSASTWWVCTNSVGQWKCDKFFGSSIFGFEFWYSRRTLDTRHGCFGNWGSCHHWCWLSFITSVYFGCGSRCALSWWCDTRVPTHGGHATRIPNYSSWDCNHTADVRNVCSREDGRYSSIHSGDSWFKWPSFVWGQCGLRSCSCESSRRSPSFKSDEHEYWSPGSFSWHSGGRMWASV